MIELHLEGMLLDMSWAIGYREENFLSQEVLA